MSQPGEARVSVQEEPLNTKESEEEVCDAISLKNLLAGNTLNLRLKA